MLVSAREVPFHLNPAPLCLYLEQEKDGLDVESTETFSCSRIEAYRRVN